MTETRNRWVGLVFISMAISLVIIDGTIVNTIFPSIINDLALTSTEVQWVQKVTSWSSPPYSWYGVLSQIELEESVYLVLGLLFSFCRLFGPEPPTLRLH